MKKKTLAISLAICAACLVLLSACGSAPYPNAKTANMKATDFSKLENWVQNDYSNTAKANADADVIFFIGTDLTEADQDNGIAYWTEENKPEAIAHQVGTMDAFDNNTRIYAPFYRQIALGKSLENMDKGHNFLPETIASTEAIVDIFASLDYYFENYNQGRPFVLAGYSQGGACVQVALEYYFSAKDHKKYLDQLVAAYSIAYGVDKTWLDKIDYIDFATGATDTGVLLSWVTEGPGGDGADILIADDASNALVINPINWKTDETYASASECLGTYVDGQVVSPGLYNLQFSAARGCLICDNNTDYMELPGYDNFWGGTSLHTYEVMQAYGSIKQNVRDRIEAFLAK